MLVVFWGRGVGWLIRILLSRGGLEMVGDLGTWLI